MQGKLLEKNESLCVDDAIDIARNYEITHSNLEQLLSPVDQDVHLIKQSRYERQSRKACNNCGKNHPDDSRNMGKQLAKDVVNQTIGPEFVDLEVKKTQSSTKERDISPQINLGNGKKISEAQRITKYLNH